VKAFSIDAPGFASFQEVETTSQSDGTFSLSGVQSVAGACCGTLGQLKYVRVNAVAKINGTWLPGHSATFVAVRGGTTSVGDITLFTLTANPPNITVGTAGSTGSCNPFLCNLGFTSGPSQHWQQIFAAAAFPNITQINSLTFLQVFSARFGGTTTVLPGHYKITLSTTNLYVGCCGFSPILANNFGADKTVVFEGDLGGVSTNPSFTINSSVPFVYDPTAGELLMDIEVTNQAGLTTGWGRIDLDVSGLTQAQITVNGGLASMGSGSGLVVQFNK